jgi:hypothetical protein
MVENVLEDGVLMLDALVLVLGLHAAVANMVCMLLII